MEELDLKKYFYHYKNKHEIVGDKEYFEKTGKKPEKLREHKDSA